MDVNKLLDNAKEVCGVKFDKDLATRLHVTQPAISNYRKGVSLPDPVVCERIAKITGVPLAKVLGVVGEARAISHAEKAVWRKLASAAAIVLVLGGFPAADAAAQSTQAMHYAQLRFQSLRVWWRSFCNLDYRRDRHATAVC